MWCRQCLCAWRLGRVRLSANSGRRSSGAFLRCGQRVGNGRVTQALTTGTQLFDQWCNGLKVTCALGHVQHTEGADYKQTAGLGSITRTAIIDQQPGANFKCAADGRSLAQGEPGGTFNRHCHAHAQAARSYCCLYANRVGLLWPGQALFEYSPRHLHLCKQAGQQRQKVQPAQRDQRPGVADNNLSARRLQARAPIRPAPSEWWQRRAGPVRRSSRCSSCLQCARPDPG